MQHIFDPTTYTTTGLSLSIGGVALLALCVGTWVLWHERARQVSVSFFMGSLAVAVYLGGFSMMVQATTPGAALFWGKVAYVGIPFIVPAVYHFSMDLLGLSLRRRWLIRAAWAVAVVYMLLAVQTDVLVPDVRWMEWGYITRITIWNLPIIAWSAILLVLALRDYLDEYRRADEVQQARIRLFAAPLLIGSLAFIDYAPSLGLSVQPWGFVVFAVYLVMAAWAVARYHLPDLTPSFAGDQIVRTMAEPLMVCDDRAALAFANPAAARLFGCPQDELVGEKLHALFGADVAARILEGDEERPIEIQVAGRYGKPIDLSVSTSPIETSSGRRIGSIVVARDIRERKQAAEEMRRREQRFRALIENARDTITILDGEGRIMYESPSTEHIMGYDPRESAGTNIFERLHPEDLVEAQRAFFALAQQDGGVADLECRIRDASGDYRVFEVQGTNLLGNPAVRGIVVNGREVTEERQLAAQLQQAQKMEAIGRLAGGVAHDFNNVLTAIQGNVALILDEFDEDGRFRAELEEIRRGADRAGRLTDQLLSFSRRQVVRLESLGLNGVVEDIRGMLERLIGESIELITRLEAEPDTVRADRGQLEQVLMNLVVNARDAVGGAGRIIVGTEPAEVTEEEARTADFQLTAGSYVLLTVTDDGAGMDAETRSRLFEPFFTTKGPGRGTGLGLSTVYGSVRQANGYIGVESREGEGATFKVFLPRAAADQRAAEAGTVLEKSPVRLEGGGDTVLVVEDEAPVRRLIARVLERRGYRVLQAEDGQKALALAEHHTGPIHLLIADLVMPGMTGREVSDRLTARYPGMAVVLISGYTADEVVRQGITTGEREFLPKPFTPDGLARKVAKVLAHRQEPAGET